jgi:hypothetical protein
MSVVTVANLDVGEFWKRLVNWFLNKAPAKLETFEEESIVGKGVTLVRYRRKTSRAYRTWRIVYKTLNYDIILGWDTAEYLPDVPNPKKRDRVSTHRLLIYRQGLHAIYNSVKRHHEPDIVELFNDELNLESLFMERTVQAWRKKASRRDSSLLPEEAQQPLSATRPILAKEDLINYMIDQIVMYAYRHPPTEIEPMEIAWREVIEQTVRLCLGVKGHRVFPDPAAKPD